MTVVIALSVIVAPAGDQALGGVITTYLSIYLSIAGWKPSARRSNYDEKSDMISKEPDPRPPIITLKRIAIITINRIAIITIDRIAIITIYRITIFTIDIIANITINRIAIIIINGIANTTTNRIATGRLRQHAWLQRGHR